MLINVYGSVIITAEPIFTSIYHVGDLDSADYYWYGYTNLGSRVERDFGDHCAMEVIVQNHMLIGLSEDEAYARFWQDVRESYPDEFDSILSQYGGSLSDANGDGALDEIRMEYLESIFYFEDASEDPYNGVAPGRYGGTIIE